jgi:hypothetical protein
VFFWFAFFLLFGFAELLLRFGEEVASASGSKAKRSKDEEKLKEQSK